MYGLSSFRSENRRSAGADKVLALRTESQCNGSEPSIPSGRSFANRILNPGENVHVPECICRHLERPGNVKLKAEASFHGTCRGAHPYIATTEYGKYFVLHTLQRINLMRCSDAGVFRAGTDQNVNKTSFLLAFTPCLWLVSLYSIGLIHCLLAGGTGMSSARKDL
ncbi:hypothetical protein L207DRAFT_601438 [Hyaloscypha variabilis F]|uniref:Uncharacterized protein n=1 Tax=Hyaloscypha variabilis (strain UAMH 11265 / GT02V1 / F) TaxID=1149755 RepID=A0A2J6REY1_HYAVF|nr:hypothetical protein L207DRAFT_601438 [Hyaloscypha variabilis F]